MGIEWFPDNVQIVYSPPMFHIVLSLEECCRADSVKLHHFFHNVASQLLPLDTWGAMVRVNGLWSSIMRIKQSFITGYIYIYIQYVFCPYEIDWWHYPRCEHIHPECKILLVSPTISRWWHYFSCLNSNKSQQSWGILLDGWEMLAPWLPIKIGNICWEYG